MNQKDFKNKITVRFFSMFLMLFILQSCSSSVTESSAGLGSLSKDNRNGVKFHFYELEYKAESCSGKKIQLHERFSNQDLGHYEFAMVASANEERDKFSVFNFNAKGLKHPYHQRIFVRSGKTTCSIKVSLSVVALMDSIFIKNICEKIDSESCKRVKKDGEEDINKFIKLVNEDLGLKLERVNEEDSFIYDPSKDSWLRSHLEIEGLKYKKLIKFSPVEILTIN